MHSESLRNELTKDVWRALAAPLMRSSRLAQPRRVRVISIHGSLQLPSVTEPERPVGLGALALERRPRRQASQSGDGRQSDA
jgi:hypothetical protein